VRKSASLYPQTCSSQCCPERTRTRVIKVRSDRPVLLGSLRWSRKPHRRAERRILAPRHRRHESPSVAAPARLTVGMRV
jgi:hypothetical protein